MVLLQGSSWCPPTRSINIPGELVRNACSQAPSQTCWIRNSGGGAQLPRWLMRSSLRSTVAQQLTVKPPGPIPAGPAGGSKGQLEELQALVARVSSVTEPACLTTLFCSLTAGSASSSEFKGHSTLQLWTGTGLKFFSPPGSRHIKTYNFQGCNQYWIISKVFVFNTMRIQANFKNEHAITNWIERDKKLKLFLASVYLNKNNALDSECIEFPLKSLWINVTMVRREFFYWKASIR